MSPSCRFDSPLLVALSPHAVHVCVRSLVLSVFGIICLCVPFLFMLLLFCKVTVGRPRPNYFALRIFTDNAANGEVSV